MKLCKNLIEFSTTLVSESHCRFASHLNCQRKGNGPNASSSGHFEVKSVESSLELIEGFLLNERNLQFRITHSLRAENLNDWQCSMLMSLAPYARRAYNCSKEPICRVSEREGDSHWFFAVQRFQGCVQLKFQLGEHSRLNEGLIRVRHPSNRWAMETICKLSFYFDNKNNTKCLFDS